MRIQSSKIKAQNSKLWKVGFITMVSVLMLLTEPILSAGKGGRGGGSGGGGGGGGGGQRSQQAKPAPSAPKAQPPSASRVQPSPSVSTTPSRVTAPSSSARSEVRSGASSPPSLNSPTTTFRSGGRQPDRIVTSPSPISVAPAPQPGPVTSSPQPSSTGGSRSVTRESKTTVGSSPSAGSVASQSKSSQSSVGRESLSGASRTEGKPLNTSSETQSALPERNRINPEKTHRIGSAIGKEKQPSTISSNLVSLDGISRTDSSVGEKKPSVSTTAKQVSGGASSHTGSDKTSRIGNSNSDRKPSVSPAANPPVISSDKTSRIGNPIGREKGGGHAKEEGSSPDSGKPVSTGKTEPANRSIGAAKPSVSSTDSQGDTSGSGSRVDSRRMSRLGESATDRKSPVPDAIRDGRRGEHKVDTSEKVQDDGGKEPAGSRLDKRRSENRTTLINNGVVKFDGDKTRIRRYERIGSSHVVYDDCPELVRHSRHYEHIYFDRHERVCHREIWPEYYFPVYYGWGPCWTFRYVYPYYHRKYVFVSLGGYWPAEYTCVRYYWYGCHPYAWCGYYPIAYEVGTDTYNYYTYNYYTYNYPSSESGTTTTAEPTQTTDYIKPVDHTTFADVREKLAKQQAANPDQETPADAYFEEAVKAFELNDYDIAIEKFAKAIEFAPDDMILPFAYAQALMADEQYTEAAGVIRAALVKVTPEKEGVFYPRGLYPSDEILFEQVDRLDEKAKLYSFDADLQLLLGYQLLGIGEIDDAVEPLRLASSDLENAAAATVLLNVLEKVRANPDVSGQNTD